MADIIEFSTENVFNIPDEPNIKDLLKEILKDADKIQDVLVCVKDKNGDKTIFHSGLELEDKAVFIQLLQHDIFNDLSPSEEIHFEPDV